MSIFFRLILCDLFVYYCFLALLYSVFLEQTLVFLSDFKDFEFTGKPPNYCGEQEFAEGNVGFDCGVEESKRIEEAGQHRFAGSSG